MKDNSKPQWILDWEEYNDNFDFMAHLEQKKTLTDMPKYVMVSGTAMIWRESQKDYFREPQVGDWSIDVKREGDKILTVATYRSVHHIHNVEVKPITKQEYEDEICPWKWTINQDKNDN